MRSAAPSATICTAVLAAATLLAPDASAARLPKWARSAVENAPPVHEGSASHVSRVLLSEVRDEVRPDGAIQTRKRLVTQALTDRTYEVSVGWFAFEETSTLRKSNAWHVLPGGRTKKSRSMPIDITYGDAFLSDTKLRAVNVKEVKKGSIVLFEFEAVDEPYILSRRHIFYEGAAMELARYQLAAPSGWTVKWAWLHHEGPPPRIEEGIWTWELSDLPAPGDEPLGPSAVEAAPWLVVNAIPPPGKSVTPAVFPDWASFSVWYEGLLEDRHEMTSLIDAAAREVLPPTDTRLSGRIRSVSQFVRDKVRYVRVDLGLGAVQPRPAWDTLSTLYGDCKDKGWLFQSLLAAGGIETYPALVNGSLADTVADEVPGWGFNHYVVAVPIPPSEDVPAALAPAVVETEEFGRLLIVDTTDEMGSFGSLSAALERKRALVVAGSRGRLIEFPDAGPDAHKSLHRIEMQLTPGGDISFERGSAYSGEFARQARHAHSASSMERRRSVEGDILNTWPGADVQEYRVEFETPQGEYLETVAWHLKMPNDPGAAARVDMFPGVKEEITHVPLRGRKTAVDYGFPRKIRYEVICRGIPDSAELPVGDRREGDGWYVETHYERTGDAVTASCEAVLSRILFEPAQFPNLRRFWLALSASASDALVLSE